MFLSQNNAAGCDMLVFNADETLDFASSYALSFERGVGWSITLTEDLVMKELIPLEQYMEGAMRPDWAARTPREEWVMNTRHMRQAMRMSGVDIPDDEEEYDLDPDAF
jgi:hypothetical protein